MNWGQSCISIVREASVILLLLPFPRAFLILRGCIFDTVKWAYRPFSTSDFDIQRSKPSSLNYPPLEVLWNETVSNITMSGSPYNDLHIAFSFTLSAGLSGIYPAEDGLRSFFKSFCAYLQEVASSSSTELDNSIARNLKTSC